MALSEFQKAFKAARASGEKEFEFEGKKYNTKYKEEVSAPAKKSASAPEVKKSGTPNLPVTKAESSDDSGEGKPYRSKNITDLIGLSSNIRKTTSESTPKEDSKETSENKKSWWTTPNPSLQGGSLPSGKEIRAALGSSYKKGGSVSSASKRADGIAQRGKTRGKMC